LFLESILKISVVMIVCHTTRLSYLLLSYFCNTHLDIVDSRNRMMNLLVTLDLDPKLVLVFFVEYHRHYCRHSHLALEELICDRFHVHFFEVLYNHPAFEPDQSAMNN